MGNSAQDTKFHEDNDSLYRMPMKIVPMETAMLRRGRLIKNAALDPAIELFRSGENGSGQQYHRIIHQAVLPGSANPVAESVQSTGRSAPAIHHARSLS